MNGLGEADAFQQAGGSAMGGNNAFGQTTGSSSVAGQTTGHSTVHGSAIGTGNKIILNVEHLLRKNMLTFPFVLNRSEHWPCWWSWPIYGQ
jgi:hypothetical protein